MQTTINANDWAARNQDRIASLLAATGRTADTKKSCAKAEGLNGLEWDGVAREHKKAGQQRLVKTADGNWGRKVGGTNRVYLLTAEEVAASGKQAGYQNC